MKIEIELSPDMVATMRKVPEPRTLASLGAGLAILGRVLDALPAEPIKAGDFVTYSGETWVVEHVARDRLGGQWAWCFAKSSVPGALLPVADLEHDR